MYPKLKELLLKEEQRQSDTINLIPSENFTSKAVREAVGSVFMHKYSEGYPGARYYEGNENIDALENLCIEMAKKVFKLPENWGVNVQPYAGSNANLAVYNALLQPGDKILSMYLPDGGHLSHGWSYTPKAQEQGASASASASEISTYEAMVYRGGSKKVNIVSKYYNVIQYKTDPTSLQFDYDFIEKLAIEEKPKLITTGGTAYPRNIDYKRMKAIADKVGAYYLADVAHEAGLIAAGVLQSPVDVADVVTMTTHKTLRGPKGAMILARGELIDSINSSIMPGLQGGPHNGTIAGITQALFEADSDEFRTYAARILANAKILASELASLGFKIVSGGTDKHLVLIDLTNFGVNGKYLSRALNYTGIVTNMNTIPYEKGSPLKPSGLRLGTPTITTRGMGEAEVKQIAAWIKKVLDEVLLNKDLNFVDFDAKMQNSPTLQSIGQEVRNLCQNFQL